jgi:acyl-CoA synthetase (NDP forming)
MSVETAALEQLVGELVAGHPSGSPLAEPEAQRITTALGIGTPPMAVVTSVDEARRVAIHGARVVVKVIGPAHKTDEGGVRVVVNTPDAIAGAIESMAGTHGGFLIAGFVDHEATDEILAGVRWTDAFGPVVTIGVGGVGVEDAPAPAVIARAVADLTEESFASAPGSARLTTKVRGREPAASIVALADIARKLLELGESAMPAQLVEFEINPLVFTTNGPVALDALAIVGSGVSPDRRGRPVELITRQLEPESIAVIGVSESTNPGRMIVRNILASGFPSDRLTVIKPGMDRIEGCACVPDVGSLREPVDLLVVAVGADAVPDLIDDVISCGNARSIALISGGLGERPGTEEAADRVRRAIIASQVAGGSPVVSGPNSMGIRSGPGRYDATFIPAERMTPADKRTHPVALVAQSGAFTLSRLDRIPWLQPRYVVTVGNQIDLTVGDYLEHFAADPEVHVAAAYIEGLAPGDGDRALRAARRIRDRGGVLLWYRGGRTAAGAKSAASHTAAVATDDLVAQTLGATAGVLEAGSLEDFDDLLRLAVLLRDRSIGGRRLGVVSNAGFECVAAADALGDLAIAELSKATRDRIEALLAAAGLGGIAGAQNPLDLTPIAGDEVYVAVVEAVLDDPGVDLAAIGCVPFSPALGTVSGEMADAGSLPRRLASLAGHPTPWVAVIDGGRLYDPMADLLEASGIPVIRSMDRAVRALAQYSGSRRHSV